MGVLLDCALLEVAAQQARVLAILWAALIGNHLFLCCCCEHFPWLWAMYACIAVRACTTGYAASLLLCALLVLLLCVCMLC